MPIGLLVVGLLGIIVALEVCRRTVGIALTILGSILFVYIFLGSYLPGMFYHRGFNLKVAVEHLFYTTEGIFGIPVAVSSTYVFLFILFGIFLKHLAGKFFLDFVTSLVGHLRGGPAKFSLLASASMGMISGSAMANVVTTGTFSIPLMKRVGFSANYAAGVESMASTGGQLTPPIMGVAAFIMAQYSGIPTLRLPGRGNSCSPLLQLRSMANSFSRSSSRDTRYPSFSVTESLDSV